MLMPQDIVLVVEDQLSLAVGQKLVGEVPGALQVGLQLVARGSGMIRKSLPKYRGASHVQPHLILTDLDTMPCAPALLLQWGAVRLPASMLLRVAVREIEAWVLADKEAFAGFAEIAEIKLPDEPELLDDPKLTLVNLVRRSRNRRLQAELVPRQGSALSIGPLYNERLSMFVRDCWRPHKAAEHAPSLQRTRRRIAELAAACSG